MDTLTNSSEVNLTSQLICQPCENEFDSYDWLFIAFHVICCLLLHYQAIWRLAVTRFCVEKSVFLENGHS